MSRDPDFSPPPGLETPPAELSEGAPREHPPSPNSPQIAAPGMPLECNTFEQMWRMAKVCELANLSGIKNAAQAMIVMNMGRELGMTHTQALQALKISTHGLVIIPAKTALALVRRSGLLERFKEWREGDIEEGTLTAHCLVQRRGEEEVTFSFSMEQAKRAQLWNKASERGGPSAWVTYPDRMLRARARSWALDDTFGDVLLGLAIAEEVEAIDVEATSRPAAAAPAPALNSAAAILAQRNATARATAAEPPQFEEPEEEGEPPWDETDIEPQPNAADGGELF